MKKINIIKTLSYDPTLGNRYSRYQGYELICTQQVDPSLLSNQTIPPLFQKSYGLILYSPQKRTQETAHLIKTSPGKTLPSLSLKEIKFSLRSLLDENEYNKYGSTLVRKKFIDAFIKDTLLETLSEIKTRADKLLSMSKSLPSDNCLLISHSFFTKILQIYISNPQLFTQPKILLNHFDPCKQTFAPGHGFSFPISV